MLVNAPYTIHPLGDSALQVDLGNLINKDVNSKVISFSKSILQTSFEGLIEVVPAYSSLAVFYDVSIVRKNNPLAITAFAAVKEKIDLILSGTIISDEFKDRYFEVPVCYHLKYGKDLKNISELLHLSLDEIIDMHTSRIYHVYMIGFLPGFPYMGEVDERLFLPRKKSPVQVTASSIGLAGKQTGIYSLDSPGGWHVIGRTPITLFDKQNENPVLFRAGDQVKFYSISPDEFENYQSGITG